MINKPKIEEKKSEGFTKVVSEFHQSEFKRPKNYIVYSEKNRLEQKIKEYEASNIEIDYLKKNDYFVNVDEYEIAISALENDVNKGEMIPLERAYEVLSKILPDKKSCFDKIYQVFSFFICLFLNINK